MDGWKKMDRNPDMVNGLKKYRITHKEEKDTEMFADL